MNQNDLDNIDIKEELEFNDGVGNALSQKQHYKFSWKKTVIVSSIGLVGVIFFTLGILEIGKILLNMNETEYVEQETIPTIESVLSESSSDTWDALPEDALNGDEANAITVTNVDEVDLNQNSALNRQLADRQIGIAETKVQDSSQQIISAADPVKAVKTNVSKPAKKKASPKQNVVKEPSVYRVIAGSFSTYNNANKELKRIKSKGYSGYVWSLTNKNGVVTYKVQLAAFSSKSKAQRFVETLKKQNIASFISTN